MGDDCTFVAVVGAALWIVATAEDSLLIAAEASLLMRLKRLVMTCNCELVALADTFAIVVSSSSLLSLLLSFLSLSFLLTGGLAPFLVVALLLLFI